MSKKRSRGDAVFTHCLGFLFCVLFPAFVTAIAPVSWMQFQRQDETVTADVRICTLFVVPYQIRTIDPVVGIGDQFIAGKETPRRGNQGGGRTEDEAYLLIHGTDQPLRVPVSPVNIRSVTERAQAFLTDSQAPELRMTVVANWKFSVFAGGLVSLLTVLYVVGVGLSIVQGVWRLIRFAPDPDSVVRPE